MQGAAAFLHSREGLSNSLRNCWHVTREADLSDPSGEFVENLGDADTFQTSNMQANADAGIVGSSSSCLYLREDAEATSVEGRTYGTQHKFATLCEGARRRGPPAYRKRPGGSRNNLAAHDEVVDARQHQHACDDTAILGVSAPSTEMPTPWRHGCSAHGRVFHI